MSTWITVVTSAGVAALVSNAITLFGQRLERRARQSELLLTRALDMAIRKSDLTMEAIKLSGQGRTKLPDEVISAETYLQWLKGLLNSGKLPPDAGE